jgi:hypothetical protein
MYKLYTPKIGDCKDTETSNYPCKLYKYKVQQLSFYLG